MNKFEKYLGKFKITVDGIELDLDVQMQDVAKIMSSQKGGEMTEESANKMIETFKQIIVRSYPEEDEKAIESFLTHTFVEFTTKFVEALGWAKEGDLTKSFQEQKKTK